MNRRVGGVRVPALVLGGGLNGLGVARSLGAAAVPVYLADTEPRGAELRTRYAKPLAISTLGGEDLVGELLVLGRKRFARQRPVLLLTQECTVRAVAGAEQTLRPLFRFVLPPAPVLDLLMHKQGFYQLAAKAGLRVPATVHVVGAAGIERALALTRPLILKPGVHVPRYQCAGLRKAYHVESENEARELLGRMLQALPDVVVQEWIPGTDADIYFCLQQRSAEGCVGASFVGRKIRSWPPTVGGTSSCTAAWEYTELAETTARFFLDVGVCGLAGMEYKRHAGTGEFVAIEPTVGRTDYQEEVATLNGVNLPYAYYLNALGLEGEPATKSKRDVVWRDGEADRQSKRSAGQMVQGWPGGAAHGRIYDALWRWNDPQPWLARLWQRLAGKRDRLWRAGRHTQSGVVDK